MQPRRVDGPVINDGAAADDQPRPPCKPPFWKPPAPRSASPRRSAGRPPVAGEVLVRIAASGVNPLDTKIHAGEAGHARQRLPAILGLDLAGTVVGRGRRVSPALAGSATRCTAWQAVWAVIPGSLAEYAAVDADLLAFKPRQPQHAGGRRRAAGVHHGLGRTWSIAPPFRQDQTVSGPRRRGWGRPDGYPDRQSARGEGFRDRLRMPARTPSSAWGRASSIGRSQRFRCR